MHAVDLIRQKRDGGTLAVADIEAFVSAVADRSLPDYQTAALLMAICLRGMTAGETTALTDAMARSGEQMTWSGLAAVPVDKHSTGGVGDKTSLILAPLAAACGARIPMMSGRGLGHTGGTLDKLESIPGFRTGLDPDAIRHAVETVGCALVGQTEAIAPADRILYALRDVTGTVESLPLIVASILSKKLAAGVRGLIFDVKTGDGAFMTAEAQARELAEALVTTGAAAGLRTEAVISRMDAPLGRAVGNAMEVVEAIETLSGRGPADVEALSVLLAARLLLLAGLATDGQAAETRIREALASGAGLEKFQQIIAAQGGDPRVVDDPARLPVAPDRHPVVAPRDGFVSALAARAIGRAAGALGAGRRTAEEAIDPAVGFDIVAPVGTPVSAGDPIVVVHHRGRRGLDEALTLLASAIAIADTPPTVPPLVSSGPFSQRGSS